MSDKAENIEKVNDGLHDLGLSLRDGKLYAACNSCDTEYQIFFELDDFDKHWSYCGKNQFCMP